MTKPAARLGGATRWNENNAGFAGQIASFATERKRGEEQLQKFQVRPQKLQVAQKDRWTLAEIDSNNRRNCRVEGGSQKL